MEKNVAQLQACVDAEKEAQSRLLQQLNQTQKKTEDDIAQLKQQADERISKATEKATDAEARVTEMEQKIQHQEETLFEWAEKGAQQEAQIEQYQKAATDGTSEREALGSQVEQKVAEIAQLKLNLKEYKSRIEVMENEKATLEHKVVDMNKKV